MAPQPQIPFIHKLHSADSPSLQQLLQVSPQFGALYNAFVARTDKLSRRGSPYCPFPSNDLLLAQLYPLTRFRARPLPIPHGPSLDTTKRTGQSPNLRASWLCMFFLQDFCRAIATSTILVSFPAILHLEDSDAAPKEAK